MDNNINITLLETHSLTKKYSNLLAVNNLDLTIPKGKIIGLLGPNGCGKTTLIKLIAGLLTPTSGSVSIDGNVPGVETKSVVSYLPERTYFSGNQKVIELLDFFETFYSDFDRERAIKMLCSLQISPEQKLKNMSKGTKEKVQLVLVMSRKAKLYLLDEPIAGVDPAARDFILKTIINNYCSDSTIIISTHLIYDIENVLDEFYFMSNGNIILHDTSDNIRENQGKSVDEVFREVFKC